MKVTFAIFSKHKLIGWQFYTSWALKHFQNIAFWFCERHFLVLWFFQFQYRAFPISIHFIFRLILQIKVGHLTTYCCRHDGGGWRCQARWCWWGGRWRFACCGGSLQWRWGPGWTEAHQVVPLRALSRHSCMVVIRILRDLCQRNPTWSPLKCWPPPPPPKHHRGGRKQRISSSGEVEGATLEKILSSRIPKMS